MAGTRRTPIARESNAPTITSHALALFAEMEKHQRARRGAAGCTIDESGFCLEECRPCQAWRDLSNELHKELGLAPWEWPPVAHCPYPPGTPDARAWSREIARSSWRADQLYVVLKAALLAARARCAADEGAIEAAT
jgi:hypothetical protein